MRYALYFAPAIDHPLWDLGNAWLGRDPASGRAFVPPELPGLTPNMIESITAAPRRYGLHATIKPPFHLADGYQESALLDRIEEFTADRASFELPPLEVAVLDDFIALRTAKRSPELHALADACVAGFDEFRAPLDSSALARRRPDTLDADALARLKRWGYPHVFEGFEFHLSLTQTVTPTMVEQLLPWLADYFAPALALPCRFDALSLYVEPYSGSPFRLMRRFPLAST